MSERLTHTDLRFDGGAPWLDFLATRGYPFSDTPAERMGDVARLAEFLDRVGAGPAAPVSDADVAAAHGLRESLRAVALAVVDDRAAPDAEALKAVQAWADRDAAPLVLVRTPRLARRRPDDAAEALARLARAALVDLTGPRVDQLHACADPICRKLFVDPGGRRKWCSAQTCGNRARVRAHRSRA
ncbi:hypothetical protein DSM104299_01355 [Baekduia alba]|uniref:CGNR zinc finger domain-containing protein n=1 Tax=Baekduia alba TaxID=2997333 RepID=UPI00233F8FE5|nr:CGNR zinc finger domain-containing protein [Baekduia alba]WCB92658.1 hypothetical protein DSM104299_01355 [Baekduia alba]